MKTANSEYKKEVEGLINSNNVLTRELLQLKNMVRKMGYTVDALTNRIEYLESMVTRMNRG